MKSNANWLWIVALLSLVMVLLIFGGILKNNFVFDDHRLVKSNPVIRTLNPMTHLSSPFWSRWEKISQYYRPLVTWSLALDYALHGAKPWGFHLTNLLLHAINVFLLFLLLREIGGILIASIGAVFFAIHPVQVESIAFIMGRTDLLSVLFLLLTTWLYARISDWSGRGKSLLLILSLITFSCALLSKELAVTFPALALAVDMARSGDGSKPIIWQKGLRRFLRWIPIYLVIILIYLAIRYSVIGELLRTSAVEANSWRNPMLEAALGVRLMTAGVVAFRYLALVVFPHHLSIDYHYDVIQLVRSPASPAFLFSLLTLVLFGSVVLILARRKPVCLFGVISLFGTYLLMSHLFFPAPLIMAERVLYLPMAGLSAVFAAIMVKLAEIIMPIPRRMLAAASVMVIIVAIPLAIRSALRVSDWRDDLTLFRATVEVAPRSTMAWNNLGVQQMNRGDYEEAIQSFQHAVGIYPGYIAAWVNQAMALRNDGKLAASEKLLRKMIREFPKEVDIQVMLIEILTKHADKLSAEDLKEEAAVLRREAVTRGNALAAEKAQEEQFGMESTLLLMVAQNLALLGDDREAEKVFDAAISAAESEISEGGAVPEVGLDLKANALGTFAWFLDKTNRPLEAAEQFINARKFAERAGKEALAARMEIRAGQALLKTSQFDAALEALHHAVNMAGDEPEIKKQAYDALLTAGETALNAGRVEDSLTIYNQLLENDPHLVRAQHGRARANLAAGNLDGAERDLKQLIATSLPSRIAAAIWNDLAIVSTIRNDHHETLNCLNKAIEFNPKFAQALYRRGLLKAQLGLPKESEVDLLAALDAGIPNEAAAEAWFYLGEFAIQRGDISAAREHLQRCLEFQPAHAKARALLKQIER